MNNDQVTGSISIKSSPGSFDDPAERRHALRASFWRNATLRPQVTPDLLFLADALEKVGHERFGWTGEEVTVREDDSISLAACRLADACGVIAKAGRSGSLKTTLWRKGAQLTPVGPETWFGASDLAIFSTCTPRRAESFVFVDAGEVARLSTLTAPDSHIGEDQYLSPYMRLMVEIVKVMGITEENPSTIFAIKVNIAELAPSYGLDVNPKYIDKPQGRWSPRSGTIELTNRLLGPMATMVRGFAAQAGKG